MASYKPLEFYNLIIGLGLEHYTVNHYGLSGITKCSQDDLNCGICMDHIATVC